MKSEPPRMYHVGTLRYTSRALAVLCFWLLWGDVCYVLMESVVPSILPLKLQNLGASNMTMALILGTVPQGISLVFNPIISLKSDRHRGPWGRRIPFILFSLPPLVLCLAGLAFGDRMASWVGRQLDGHGAAVSPVALALGVTAVLMMLFAFFNTFINSVFWYLFNDVVPEKLLARFMSWFRVVSVASVSLYNFCIFRFAGTHATAILLGAAVLYAIGFSLMCFFVREGEYPPPRNSGKTGVVAAVKTYAHECHGLAHYRYVFLVAIGAGAGTAGTDFMLFFYQSTGLDLQMIGTIRGVEGLAMIVGVLISGWLADRFHPIRVVIAGVLLQLTLAFPATLLWLFWEPSPRVSYYLWLAITISLIAPAKAMVSVLDPPLFMRIFPRENYGQFCSANALWRSAAMILGALVVGAYLDVLGKYFGKSFAYRFLPIWNIGVHVGILLATLKLYQSWKRHGGDLAYVAPLPNPLTCPADNNLQVAAIAGAAAAARIVTAV
ncbi:MAG: hypothetical protein JWM57_2983 [Phycisphaerales bacterium]|nr:hypothetical protein [Phycisphaerales bacterium]